MKLSGHNPSTVDVTVTPVPDPNAASSCCHSTPDTEALAKAKPTDSCCSENAGKPSSDASVAGSGRVAHSASGGCCGGAHKTAPKP
ncbi:hypothetical protein [Tahibacter amnicola]|uniref:Uncharacterized protein n=1 Tax=Tahibacter amnicola TaxID=2976241 RepID=A0ABY6BDS8_9GAMM|nr:hypothetical protein [Tahibacter amnicola]UXI66057.1 hypothetical protein N4264_14990 [Tahibacter amnicola]